MSVAMRTAVCCCKVTMRALYWSPCRAHDMRSLHLIGITLLLPQPELDYFRAFAQNSNYFVVEMSGTTPIANVPGVLRCAGSVCSLCLELGSAGTRAAGRKDQQGRKRARASIAVAVSSQPCYLN
jgi:hypothetical protein